MTVRSRSPARDLLPLGVELALPLLQAEQELLPLQRAARKLRLEHLPLHVDAVGLFVAGQDFQLVELLAQVLVRLVAVVEAVLPLGGQALELDLDLRKAHVVGPLPKDGEHVARLHALAVLHAVLDELRVLGLQVHRDLAHGLHGGRGAELLDEGSALHAHGALVGRLLPGGGEQQRPLRRLPARAGRERPRRKQRRQEHRRQPHRPPSTAHRPHPLPQGRRRSPPH